MRAPGNGKEFVNRKIFNTLKIVKKLPAGESEKRFGMLLPGLFNAGYKLLTRYHPFGTGSQAELV
jgi:hypothetical protein